MVALRRESGIWRGLAGLRRLYPGGLVEATHPLGLALASLDHVCPGLGCARARRRRVRCSAHCDTRQPAQSGIAIFGRKCKPRQGCVLQLTQDFRSKPTLMEVPDHENKVCLLIRFDEPGPVLVVNAEGI
jgi:hypothetical protein